MSDNIPRSANLPAGYDEENPYEDEDIEEFPSWWAEGIELFRDHGLRPYRPPQFSDGTLTPEFISELEAEFDISIQFKAVNPRFGDDWGIWIDGDKIAEIPRTRTEEGRTVYEIDSDLFREEIRRVASKSEENQE